MSDEDFEELVREALDGLPEDLASRISNVSVVVDPAPSRELELELDFDPTALLGLYQGVPLTERDAGYFGVLPDQITLFKDNILAASDGSDESIRELVRTTVIHEVAHHFGIDDDRLDELGWG